MSLRVAVVHDYLTQRGGAERVVLAMMRAFPDARLITSVYNPDTTYPEFQAYPVETLWLNRVGPVVRDPRRALPVLASAFSAHEVSDVDIVVCSSSGWSHGVSTAAPKIVYCHNPARWLHQTADYLAGHGMQTKLLLGALRRPLLRWDHRAARSATAYLANSSTVRERVRHAYGLDAEVLHPAVGIDPYGPQEPVPGLEPGFLLSVSRPRAYKHAAAVARAVEALPDERLVMVGGVPEPEDGRPWSPRITGVSDISDEQLRWLYANCSALLGVGHEDFGLTPIEANAFGKPVICLRAGGYLDTVVAGVTGVFVDDVHADAVIAGIRHLRARVWDGARIRLHAEQFGHGAFAHRLREIAHRVHDQHTGRRTPPTPRRRPLVVSSSTSSSSSSRPAQVGPGVAAFSPLLP